LLKFVWPWINDVEVSVVAFLLVVVGVLGFVVVVVLAVSDLSLQMSYVIEAWSRLSQHEHGNQEKNNEDQVPHI
jgi:hypothetical protein